MDDQLCIKSPCNNLIREIFSITSKIPIAVMQKINIIPNAKNLSSTKTSIYRK